MGALDVKCFRELTVWHEAIELVVDCYRFANALPPSERFGMVAQMKRCATSIPANIAEGHRLSTHLHVSVRLGLCSEQQTRAISKRREYVGRMLNRLAAALKRKVESEARRAGVSRKPEP